MELLVATWTIRVALLAAFAVAGLTLSAGGSILDAVNRAALAAAVFTVGGRVLIGALETPEQRIQRLRIRRDKRRAKSAGEPAAATPAAAPRTRAA